MLNINLTPEEVAQCEEFWNTVDPMLIDDKASELLNEYVDSREQIETITKRQKEVQKLLLYYRREFTEVDEAVQINEKGLVLRRVNNQAIDFQLFNQEVGLNSFLQEVSQKVLSLQISETKELLALLSFFSDKEKKEKLERWKELNILQVDTKYDLSVK